MTRSEEELMIVPSSSETLVHLNFMSTHFNILSTCLRKKKRDKQRLDLFFCSFWVCSSSVFLSTSLTNMPHYPFLSMILKIILMFSSYDYLSIFFIICPCSLIFCPPSLIFCPPYLILCPPYF